MNIRRWLIYLVLAALVVGLYAGLAAARGSSGYPLDDAWIHQTYARNWAATGQLAYVPGLPSAGSTAPLWTLLLSIAYRLNVDPYLWTLLLGTLSLATSAWLLARLADRLMPNRSLAGWLAGLACVLEWHMIWAAASGMEALLFIALALAVIDRVQAKASGWIVGALCGLLVLTRPEGLLLIVLVIGVMIGQGGRASLKTIAQVTAAILIVLAPGVYFNLQAGGSIFPNTFFAKQSEYAELTRTLSAWLGAIGSMLSAPLAGGTLLFIPGVVMWIVRNRRDVRDRDRWALWLPLAWAVVHTGVYALRLPVSYQHGRYLLPVIPVILLYGVAGALLLSDWLKTYPSKPAARLTRRVYIAALMIVFVLYIPIGAAAFATDVAIIDGEMVAVAKWLDTHTPPAAIIAAHDIGAIGYFARRPILDLAGLISPEVIPFIRDEARLSAWMQARGAQYLVTFPGWYPQLSKSPEWNAVFEGDSSFSPEHMTVYALAPQS